MKRCTKLFGSKLAHGRFHGMIPVFNSSMMRFVIVQYKIIVYLGRLSDVRKKNSELLVDILSKNDWKVSVRTVRAWTKGTNVPRQSKLILSILKQAFGDKKQGKGK